VIISCSQIRRFQLIIIDLNVNTPITLEICGRLGQLKLEMKIVEKMQLNMVIFEVVDSGDLFTGAVITRNVNVWAILIKFGYGEIVI